MTDELKRILELAKPITKKYKLLQCQNCAKELEQVFKENGFSGEVLVLSPKYKTKGGFIMLANPKMLSKWGISTDEPISNNNRHVGVDVGGYVFDNIHKLGVPRKQWAKQFDCAGHLFTLTPRKFKPGETSPASESPTADGEDN